MPSVGETWLRPPEEGQLAIDAFRDGDDLVVRSVVAGVRPEDLEISVHGDLLTIRGTRPVQHVSASREDWYYRECYWGSFSRSVVLPFEVMSDAVHAKLKNGILDIRFPIREFAKKVPISWEA